MRRCRQSAETRRRSFRPTPELLEGRQLLATTAALNQQLQAGVNALLGVIGANNVAFDSVTYTYQDIGAPAFTQALQEQNNTVAAAASGKATWDAAWADSLATTSLLEQSYQVWIAGFADGDNYETEWYQLRQQAEAEMTVASVFVGQVITDVQAAEASPTWIVAQAPPPTPTPTPPAPKPAPRAPLLHGSVTNANVDIVDGVPDGPGWAAYKNALHALLESRVFVPERAAVRRKDASTVFKFTVEYHPNADGHLVNRVYAVPDSKVPPSRRALDVSIRNALFRLVAALNGQLPKFPDPNHAPLNIQVTFTFNNPGGDRDFNYPLAP